MGFMSKNISRYFKVDHADVIDIDGCVVLTRVSSIVKFFHFDKETRFYRVRYDRKKSNSMKLYLNSEMYVYTFGYTLHFRDLGICKEDLISEVHDYLERGHSVRDADCACLQNCDSAKLDVRQADYGFYGENGHAGRKRIRHDECFLPHKSCAKTSKQICFEVGAESMESQIEHGQSLRDCLLNSGLFQVHAEMWELECKNKITTPELLLRFLRKFKLGVHTSHHHLQYEKLYEHIGVLVHNGDVIWLKSENVFYVNFLDASCRQKKCDSDICQLWQKCEVPK